MTGIKVYLSLGSNIGDRNTYLNKGVQEIGRSIGKIQSRSPIYETEAWGKTDQAGFLNMVVCSVTDLGPYEVLDRLQQIERENGRERLEHWGPRTLDIDILFFGDVVMEDNNLIIPHPELTKRSFVLVPLSDVAADLIHPVENQSIKELLHKLRNQGDVKPYNKS